jgi:hypothetical protein
MDKGIVVGARGIVCAVMLAGLAACGGGGGSDSSGSTTSSSSSGSSGSTSSSASSSTSGNLNSSPTVSPANAAPQISGNPGVQVPVGQAYSFTPSATDSEGDSLTFSIASKPTWASFNTATGQLSGTPGAAHVGSHEEITISVSDGHSTVTLAQFEIDVVQQSSGGNVTLAWQAPTENTDGTALTNLSGYKIYYGTQSGAYSASITLNNAGLTTYVVENLSAGTYFFAISAIANGVESDFSAEASKSI